MKTIYSVLFLTALIFSTIQVKGQNVADDPKFGDDPESRKECQNNLSVMSEFVRIKTYEYAYTPWQAVFKECPASSKNIYIYGERLLNFKIDEAKTDQEKQAYVDTLLLMYDKRIEYFGEEGKVLGKKGIDLLKFRRDEITEAYKLLKKSLELEKNKVDEAVAATLITTSAILFGNGELDGAEFVSNYVAAIDALQAQRPNPNTIRAIESIEKTFSESGAATCEDLTGIFTPKFEATPNDVELLKKITELLKRTDCQESDLFASASENLFQVEPTARAGANLGIVFTSRGDYNKAVEYFQKAVDIETDPDSKADYYYGLAIAYQKMDNKPKSREAALNSANLKSGFGDPYLLIGQLYASSKKECENDPLPASVYWVAVDMFKKAKTIDPKLSESADKLISSYSPHYPDKQEAFFQNVTEGNSYTVGSWINEKTTARFNN